MKISVITVCYNAVSTIESSILSLLEQDYEDVEYIVIDGGSADGTVGVINRYLSHISYFSSEPDNGIYDALNKGIEHATGDVIGILHANDCFASQNVLSTIAQVFQSKDVDAVYSDLIFYNDKGETVRKWKSATSKRLLLELGWMPPHPTLFIKKKIYDQYGNYRLDFGTAADYELILRFFYRYRIKTGYVNLVFVKMLTGGLSNKSILSHVRGNINDFKAMKKHGLHAPFIAVFLKPLQKLIQYL
ncbi:glycosyltransferase family 2 protein [Mucilaginibacter arboris]|uniref:Glycosyltransferase n=1 Tax=Mucilaginibacter arboris TaxID=2682090 RepID=A0A7K1STK1_9SPHI|nr:glycosyltransferase family 2 protein [Mucilaginibacter arboris]MVN20632.1 glycosyltransferase [Mucilaginibacter arboris]